MLIQPLGFTSEAFGDSHAKRLKSFKRRLILSHLQFHQTIFHDPRNLIIDMNSLRSISKEKVREFNQKYADGVSYNSSKDCAEAAIALHRQDGKLTMLLGEKDKLFTPSEVLATLSKAGTKYVKTIVVPGASHGTLGNRAGKNVLKQALAIARA